MLADDDRLVGQRGHRHRGGTDGDHGHRHGRLGRQRRSDGEPRRQRDRSHGRRLLADRWRRWDGWHSNQNPRRHDHRHSHVHHPRRPASRRLRDRHADNCQSIRRRRVRHNTQSGHLDHRQRHEHRCGLLGTGRQRRRFSARGTQWPDFGNLLGPRQRADADRLTPCGGPRRRHHNPRSRR